MSNLPKQILPDDDELNITKNQLTMLMMESFKKSSTSTEEILCLKEVAKINDMYDHKPQNVTLINVQQNIEKLEVMSDEELLKLSGNSVNLFDKVGALEDHSAKHKDPGAKYVEDSTKHEVLNAKFEEVTDEDAG